MATTTADRIRELEAQNAKLDTELMAFIKTKASVEALFIYCGWCRRCKEFQQAQYECPRCHAAFVEGEAWDAQADPAWPVESPQQVLVWQYTRLLLMVAPVMSKAMTPSLYEVIDKQVSNHTIPASPAFHLNMTKTVARKAIRDLMAVAREHNLLPADELAFAHGVEVEIEYGGEKWVALELPNGTMRRLHRVIVSDSLANIPSDFPGADKMATCPDCGQEFTGPQANFALSGHRRKHKIEG